MTGNKNKHKYMGGKGIGLNKSKKNNKPKMSMRRRPPVNRRLRDDNRRHYSPERRRYTERFYRRSRSGSRPRSNNTFCDYNGGNESTFVPATEYNREPEIQQFNNHHNHFSPPPRTDQSSHYSEEVGYVPRYESPRRSPELRFEPPPTDLIRSEEERWSEREDFRNQDVPESTDFRNRSPPKACTPIPNFVSPEEGHPMVPSFNGEDTNLTSRQWVKIVEEIGQAENWNCQDKRFQMISKFVGTPKEWLLKQDCFGENWNRLKRTFVRAFPSDMDYHNLLKRMVIRTKTDSETYSNYFTFKTMLLKSCNITGRKAISCLIGGFMDEDLKNLAYDQNFETAEALYSFLMKQEQFKKSRPKPPEELIANFSKVCYGCNMNGHLFEDCSDNPKNKVSGHVMINPKNFVDVWINGYSVQAYNDISSHFVMIREDQAKSMNINYKYNTKMICGYKGNPVTTLGEVSIAIRVNAVTVNIDAFIVPSSAEDFGVILGDNLRNHPDICYEENPNSISFSSAVITHTERSSFSMNEELMKNINDMNGSSKGVQRNRHHRGKPEKHERQQQSQFEPPFGSSSTSRHYRYN